MNILRLMTPKSAVAYISKGCSLRQGLEKMRHHGYNALPVLDDEGHYVGMVKDGDFLWRMLDLGTISTDVLEEIPLTDILRHDNPAVLNSASFEEVLERSKENNFVPLVDDRGCFIGLIRRKDVINHLSFHHPA